MTNMRSGDKYDTKPGIRQKDTAVQREILRSKKEIQGPKLIELKC